MTPEPSYYDVSPLKPPLWRWEIAWYFYLGGLSAGAYAISRMAERFGGKEFRDISKVGSYVAMAAFLPCPPLLIADLGDPKRFHHMLRVFKPSSPMSLGTWAIVGYSGMAATQVVREYLRDEKALPAEKSKLARMTGKTLLALHDAAGVPFALVVAGYTGVLLSCTANPLWSRSKWIGPLFTASALSTGAAAISLALPGNADSPSHRALEKIDTAAHLTEAACLAGFIKERGELAKPLTTGGQRHHLRLACAGIVVSEVLKHLPLPGKAGRFANKLAAAVGLATGLSLRWAFIYGGREAAKDAHLSRLSTRPKTEEPAR